MPQIKINQDNLFHDKIGSQGLDTLEFFAWEDKIKEILAQIEQEIKTDQIAWPNLPFEKDEIQNITHFTKQEKKKWEEIIVLGIGGSALGTIALQTALQQKASPKLTVLDNIDPDYFTEKLTNINWSKTLLIVISKSGKTPETMAQFYVLENLLKHELKAEYKKHIIAITDATEGELRKIVNQKGYHSFTIPANVGGRFSVLTAVGLLPAALIGIDIFQLTQGAQNMTQACFHSNLAQNPAALLAIAAFLLDRKKKIRQHVMLSYSNKLFRLTDWYRQLLAESIGKNENTGLTPQNALGSTDQHSQLQLWNAGPKDKLITFLEVKNFEHIIPIPDFENSTLNYLKNSSFNALILAEKSATMLSLTQQKVPNQTIEIPKITPEVLGELFFLFEMQIAILGKLYEVDPYDQPGVEEGKNIVKNLMQK